VSRIDVLVAATSLDMKAEVIAAAVAQRSDMTLIEGRVVATKELNALLDTMPPAAHCALVLVGPHGDTKETAARWLSDRKNLVVLRVDIIEDVVRIAVRDVGLDSLLTALRQLAGRAGYSLHERILQFQLQPLPAIIRSGSEPITGPAPERALLNAAIDWVHAVLRVAVGRSTAGNGDLPGLTVTAASVGDLLKVRPARTAGDIEAEVEAVDAALSRALAGGEGLPSVS
jgi:hypothetical protein